jgi:hypothetical protein
VTRSCGRDLISDFRRGQPCRPAVQPTTLGVASRLPPPSVARRASGRRRRCARRASRRRLPVDAADRDGPVTPDLAARTDGQRLVEVGFGDGVDGGGSPRLAPAHQARVRGLMVVRVEEGQQPHEHLVQRRALAEEVQASLAHRPPEALHFAASLRLIRRAVHEPDVETAARSRQCLASTCRHCRRRARRACRARAAL